MKRNFRWIKPLFKLSPLATLALLGAVSACAPLDPASQSQTLPPPNPGQVTIGQQGQNYNIDFSLVPQAVNSLMGTYTGSIVKKEFGGETSSRPFSFTMTKHQNTTGQGVPAYGTLTLELPAHNGLPAVTANAYVGVNPTPYYGSIYHLQTNAFDVPALVHHKIAIRMFLAVNSQNQFDPTRSGMHILDCGFSQGTVCSNEADLVSFGSDLRKR